MKKHLIVSASATEQQQQQLLGLISAGVDEIDFDHFLFKMNEMRNEVIIKRNRNDKKKVCRPQEIIILLSNVCVCVCVCLALFQCACFQRPFATLIEPTYCLI